MRREGKRPLLFLFVFLSECVLLLSTPAPATPFDVYGGPGGESFTALCPSGYHMVGLEGRTGKWIDKMAPICGSWIPERQGFVNRIAMKAAGTSEGGAPAACGMSAWIRLEEMDILVRCWRNAASQVCQYGRSDLRSGCRSAWYVCLSIRKHGPGL